MGATSDGWQAFFTTVGSRAAADGVQLRELSPLHSLQLLASAAFGYSQGAAEAAQMQMDEAAEYLWRGAPASPSAQRALVAGGWVPRLPSDLAAGQQAAEQQEEGGKAPATSSARALAAALAAHAPGTSLASLLRCARALRGGLIMQYRKSARDAAAALAECQELLLDPSLAAPAAAATLGYKAVQLCSAVLEECRLETPERLQSLEALFAEVLAHGEAHKCEPQRCYAAGVTGDSQACPLPTACCQQACMVASLRHLRRLPFHCRLDGMLIFADGSSILRPAAWRQHERCAPGGPRPLLRAAPQTMAALLHG